MIHIETSPIEYLFWAVVIFSLLTAIACMVLSCWMVASKSRRKGVPVVVRKKSVPHKCAPKKIEAVPASFDTATFIKIYVENHPDLKRELMEELRNA